MVPVRMHQALDNENEPGWAEVKQLKDIVGGCAPSSPEAIELNLARAIKSGGMKNDDIGKSLIAFKVIGSLGIDPATLAKVMFLEKSVCENGAPGSEVGRVLSDGVMPHEAVQAVVNEIKDTLDTEQKPADIETTVNFYNNLKFKSNIPTEVIEFVDKSLIQVRCSLEDVADNMISSLQARGEKTGRIVNQVTDMLKKTGATAAVTASTLLPPLVDLTGDPEIVLTRVVARNLKEVDYETEEVKGAMTDIIVRIIEDDPSQYPEGISSQEAILKDCGMSLPEIKDYIAANLPPPPTPPEEIERRRQMAEELERLEKAEAERERLEKLKESDPEAYEREVNPTKAVNKSLAGIQSDSRRGSLIPGRSRQGSIALGGPDRATVAMITDDPENKKNLKVALAGAFEDSAISKGDANTNNHINENGSTNINGVSPISGDNVQKNSDGSISIGGHKLPPGTVVDTNPDGSISVKGDLLGDLPANASEEEIASRLAAAGITGDAAKQMMSAVKSGGGAMSAETRKLMEQILASSGDKDETSARVAALLAGSSLTTTRGAKRGDGREVDMVQYEGTNMEDMKERKDTFEMPEVPNVNIPQLRDGGLTNGHGLSNGLSNGVTMRDHSGGAGGIKRGSIKRQSEIMREKKMSRQEEREEERKRKESYFRKVTGLRKAKVPLMVYSCGGFSRCFRIARFYDLEGPPVGVEYSKPEDDRKALNPEL